MNEYEHWRDDINRGNCGTGRLGRGMMLTGGNWGTGIGGMILTGGNWGAGISWMILTGGNCGTGRLGGMILTGGNWSTGIGGMTLTGKLRYSEIHWWQWLSVYHTDWAGWYWQGKTEVLALAGWHWRGNWGTRRYAGGSGSLSTTQTGRDDTDRGKMRYSEITRSQRLSTTQTELDWSPALRCQTPAANLLNHSTAWYSILSKGFSCLKFFG
jgi:hypothetical protein